MAEPAKAMARFEGPGGVTVELFDQTANYAYRDIYHLKLKVVARFASTPEVFERTLEKMGVFADDLDRARRELVESFEVTGLPYLFKEEFARRLDAQRRAERAPKPAASYGG